MGTYLRDLRFLTLNLVGRIPSQRVRHALYRQFGMTIGRGSVIYNSCEVREPARVVIGEFSSIGDRCVLDGRGGLTIGSSVNFSTGVWIWTMEHEVNARDFAAAAHP